MDIDWEAVRKAMYPNKDYEELCHRLEASFSYAFVREKFNLTMPELMDFSERLLGGDARGRYKEYLALLEQSCDEIQQSGIKNVMDLLAQAGSCERLEGFVQQSGIGAPKIALVLTYLLYWFIPGQKLLSGLVREGSEIDEAIKVLRSMNIRTNLDLLEQGKTSAGRKALVEASGLHEEVIMEFINRADFSRLPWARKATISNIIGAGYRSMEDLARANPEQLYRNFYEYGKSIGKNLKLGNEIENSHRIARIVPVILQEDA